MIYNKYLIKKEKTDLLSSLKQVNKTIINENLEKKALDNINELKEDIIDRFEFCLEMSKDDKNTIAYFTKILIYENTNQMVIYDVDIEALWAFVYKNKNGYSYYLADEIKDIIIEKLDINDFEEELTASEENMDDLEIYLDNISNKYLNELYNNLEFKEGKLSKKENILLTVNTKIIKTIVGLTNEDIEQIRQVISGNIPEKINDVLMGTYIFYDKYGDKKYFISDGIKEIVNNFNINEMESDKKVIYTVFYIEANGVIKIDKLIELIKETGIRITKKEIKNILKETNYYINNDIIFVNKLLFDTGFGIKLLKEKEKIPYITYSQIELILMFPLITSGEYFDRINAIIHKKVKDEIEAEMITDLVFTTIRMLIDYENEVLNILERHNIKLANKDMEKLFDVLEEAEKIYPKWSLNGKVSEDFDFGFDDEEISFEELSKDEKIEIYISQYLAINGVMKFEKMLEILDYHDMRITKKELIKIIKNIKGIAVYKDYICFEDVESNIDQFLKIKTTSNFKLIEDVDQFIDEFQYNSQKVKDICLKYGISEETSERILAFMTYGFFDKELLNRFLMENFSILPKTILDSLYKELLKVSKDIRSWKYNGYTENEMKLLQL